MSKIAKKLEAHSLQLLTAWYKDQKTQFGLPKPYKNRPVVLSGQYKGMYVQAVIKSLVKTNDFATLSQIEYAASACEYRNTHAVANVIGELFPANPQHADQEYKVKAYKILLNSYSSKPVYVLEQHGISAEEAHVLATWRSNPSAARLSTSFTDNASLQLSRGFDIPDDELGPIRKGGRFAREKEENWEADARLATKIRDERRNYGASRTTKLEKLTLTYLDAGIPYDNHTAGLPKPLEPQKCEPLPALDVSDYAKSPAPEAVSQASTFASSSKGYQPILGRAPSRKGHGITKEHLEQFSSRPKGYAKLAQVDATDQLAASSSESDSEA